MTALLALGNPGDRYTITRHNVGWIMMDIIFPDVDWHENKYAEAFFATAEFGDVPFTLAKPQTFMNESGKTAQFLIEKEKVSSEKMIVLYDDIDLALGKIKISFDRGSGGHNGIKSIEECLGSRQFIRVRIGISKVLDNGELVKPNVLGNFEPEEMQVLKNLAPQVRKALETIILEGKEKAMTEFNK